MWLYLCYGANGEAELGWRLGGWGWSAGEVVGNLEVDRRVVTVAWRQARSPAWLGGCRGPGAGLGSWARAVGDLGAFDRGVVKGL